MNFLYSPITFSNALLNPPCLFQDSVSKEGKILYQFHFGWCSLIIQEQLLPRPNLWFCQMLFENLQKSKIWSSSIFHYIFQIYYLLTAQTLISFLKFHSWSALAKVTKVQNFISSFDKCVEQILDCHRQKINSSVDLSRLDCVRVWYNNE